MKLRLYRNSVRLRLNKADVNTFIAEGTIGDRIDFGPGLQLSYRLETSSLVDSMQANYSPGCLRILLPSCLAEEWAHSDLIGIRGGGSPSLLIEKNFQCLHKHSGEERDPDAWPHPLAAGAQRGK
jgi:hypothetical protein